MQNETLRPESTPSGLENFSPPIDGSRLAHAPGTLVDKYGRRVTYVRLSITDRCDFRCTYCMAEEMTFLPRHEVMSLEECLQLATVFVSLGVNKLRITGGEPLVRKNALWLIERLGALPGLDNLVITTNGSQLERFAPALKAAGVKRINISLDTLRADRFKAITRIGDLDKVLSGIKAAQAAGFRRTKLNAVMMRGTNDDEFGDLVRFALDNELDLSFIEEMPLGEIHGRSNTYISSEEAREQLARRFELIPFDRIVGRPGALLAHSRLGIAHRLHLAAQPQFLRQLQPRADHRQGRALPLPRAERRAAPDAHPAPASGRRRPPASGDHGQHGHQAVGP